MVKFTILGRVSDGLPLVIGPRFLMDGNESMVYYKQKGDLILRKISQGAIAPTKMSIRVDHYCFHYIIENGVCYITLCASSYPRKLAFHFLDDLQKEFQKVDMKFIEDANAPYAFTRFDYRIGNIRKKYLDTRTQANLAKLNANRKQDLDIITEDISTLIGNGSQSDNLERQVASLSLSKSTLWCTPLLEVIALKWTPFAIVGFVGVVLLWTSFILTDFSVVGTI